MSLLAALSGLQVEGGRVRPRELLEGFSISRVPARPVVLQRELLPALLPIMSGG
jgi:hypothetical protein